MGELKVGKTEPAPPTRSGFVALAGRPNVGKSTLANAIVGAKVAIVSDKPQTTRRAIRGVANGPDWQLVLVDLPGVQRPRDALTERMQQRVEHELADADGCLLVVNAMQGIGPGDRFIASLLRPAAQRGVHVAIAVNKVDRLSRSALLEVLAQAGGLGLEAEVFPISARTGEGLAELVAHLGSLLPEGPFLFDAVGGDQPADVLAAELIREAAIRRTFPEVPHALEVIVEELERERELLRVRALIWVETGSQKGILIGARGTMIKAIGTAARKELERAFGGRVHLDLSVRVRRDWRADDGLLDRLGIS